MEHSDIVVESINNFKQTLKSLKDYILEILKSKSERQKEKTKEDLKEALSDTKTQEIKKEEKSEKNIFNRIFDKLFDIENPNPTQDIQVDKSDPKDINKSTGSKYEQHFQEKDEYSPQDSEFGESIGETPRFAEISPGLLGLYTAGKYSYFDSTTNLWSKRKTLSELNIKILKNSKPRTYAGVIKNGVAAIPLPHGSLPDLNSLHYTGKSCPIFLIDQNNCVYISSDEKQYISFNFYTNQNLQYSTPISEEREKIIYDKLTNQTTNLLKSLSADINSAQIIKDYIIKTKKYSTKYQGTLKNKSNSSNYISNLDKSELLECFSANSLFVALCREIGLAARVIGGHSVQFLDKEGKALLSSSNGHAWAEVWDDSSNKWIKFDATPTIKEDGDDSKQNSDGNSEGDGESNSGNNQNKSNGEPSSEKSDPNNSPNSRDQQQNGTIGQSSGSQQQGPSLSDNNENRSPSDLLDELIEKAKQDSIARQEDELLKTLDKLDQAESKKDIREILDKSGLEEFAKDMIDKAGNEEILRQEKDELSKLDDENEIDDFMKNSLLDNDFKEKLKKYADELKKQIEEDKRKAKSEMKKMGFEENEIHLYKMYKELEKEIAPEVRKQIQVLKNILPPQYHLEVDEQNYYSSGPLIGGVDKLVEYELTKDPKILLRYKEVKDTTMINMFETILIDRSGSMGDFKTPGSALREAVKAAIIRAKVLEYFNVMFSILIFDENLEEVMSFGEKFSSRGKCFIPSKLMRAVMKSGSTDIGKPLTHTFESMKQYQKRTGIRSFGNISFLGDGSPTDGMKGVLLKGLISQIRQYGFGLTAYYINGTKQNMNELEQYFGSEDSGGTVVVSDVKQLTEKLLGNYNKNLKKIIARYSK